MRIGFTFKKEQKELLLASCDKVVVSEEGSSVTKTFEKFVKEHLDDEIYLYSWEESNMKLAQLYPALVILRENKKIINFVKKDPLSKKSDEEFFNNLFKFAVIEVGIMKERTEKGIALAKDQGLFPGRPRIDEATIEKIRMLYKTRKKTFQEIADECRVSVGTVYKYAVTEKKISVITDGSTSKKYRS